MSRTSAYARLSRIVIFLFLTFSAAFGQVNGSALVSALTGKTVVPTVELGYTGSVANPVMVNGQPAMFPVKTLVYPDGHEWFRVESGILHADAAQYKTFNRGLEFRIGKVELKGDYLELKLPCVIEPKQSAVVKLMLGSGWQKTMTNEAVLKMADRFLSDPSQHSATVAAKAQPPADAQNNLRIMSNVPPAPQATPSHVTPSTASSGAASTAIGVAPDSALSHVAPSTASSGTEGRLGPQNASSDIGGTGTDRYANSIDLRIQETYCSQNDICSGPSYDVYTMEMSGVRLWMTPDEAKAGLIAKLGDHAQIQVKYAASRLNSSHYVGEMTVSDGDFYIKVSFIEIAPGDAPHPVEAAGVYLLFQDNVNVTRADLDELEKSATAKYGYPTLGGGRTWPKTWCLAVGWDRCDDGPKLNFNEDGLSLVDQYNPLRDSMSKYLQRINNLKNKPPL
jgi:hypothetical protein